MQVSNYYLLFLFVLVWSGICPTTSDAQVLESHVLWEQGSGDYNNYRIPAVVVSTQGTVLAFCEGREAGDAGDIDILLRRSEDNGKTWGDEMIVWDDEQNTCGNPCPVVDDETGRIWLWLTWNCGTDHETDIIHKRSKYPRKPYLCYSDDDGLTWSDPQDMSATCRDDSWGWYATGPGFAIHLKNGNYKGRMVVPANHSYDDPTGNIRKGPYGYGAHVLISDDNGKTWRMSEPIKPGCNESQVTELSDGTLIMNMRSYNDKYCRAISYSKDGGETWSEIDHDYQLVESRCQASILNYGEYKGKTLHLFANPAVPKGRSHMTIKISDDDCNSWKIDRLINANPSAYSCLVKLPKGKIGLFYETGVKKAYETMTFEVISLKELF